MLRAGLLSHIRFRRLDEPTNLRAECCPGPYCVLAMLGIFLLTGTYDPLVPLSASRRFGLISVPVNEKLSALKS